MRTKPNCKNCNNPISENEISDYGLCWNCYQDYLLKKIENAQKNKTTNPPEKTISEKIHDFIEKIKSRFSN